MDPLLLVLIAMIVFLAFQFFFNGRRRKQQEEKRKEQLVPGVNVMTSSGLFGKVVAVMSEEKKVIVEIAPGVDVTFHIQAVTNFETPEEEGKNPASDSDSAEADDSAAADTHEPAGDAVDASKTHEAVASEAQEPPRKE